VQVIEDDGGRFGFAGEVDFGAVDDVVVLDDLPDDGIVVDDVDEDGAIALVGVVDEEEEDEDEDGESSMAHGGDADVGPSVARTGEIATRPRNPTARPTSERRYIDTPISDGSSSTSCLAQSLNRIRDISSNYSHKDRFEGNRDRRNAAGSGRRPAAGAGLD
jgi:hypothetical protein